VLATKEHPDKGGSLDRFRALQQAYETLSDDRKRAIYDQTGTITRTAEEEFVDGFGGGNFRDRGRDQPQSQANLAEQLTVRQVDQSHTAGFEAWMRSRGTSGVQTFTSDDIISQFGVVKGSYESVALPKIKAYAVSCQRAGLPKEVLTVDMEDIPAALEWGEVLVSMRMMPINPADLYTIQTGGMYGNDPTTYASSFPFCPGHDGVGIVLKNGPGVKEDKVREGDWVIPLRPNAGTWRSLAVLKDKDLLVIPAECMPMDQVAVVREMITAYRVLEDANLKPGDCVLLNGASGTVGQLVVQLCHLLRLRAVAVVSDSPSYEKTAALLTKLGAVHVVKDQGSIKAELAKLKFFAKPKLGLDCIGGDSTVRLSDALAEGGQLIIYGCMSGRSPSWNWKLWVFNGLRVKGFNTRTWMGDNIKKVPQLVETIGKLVRSNKLMANVTEYELGSEFDEALDHAMDRYKNTKVVLRVSDVGEHA
jgi:trans-2-enoyl-CoA reductase